MNTTLAATRRTRLPAWTAALPALVMAGCAATTQVETQWSDPQFQGQPLRGTKVFVMCQADDLALKHQCEDQVVAQLTAVGVTPVVGGDTDNVAPGVQPTPGQFLDTARALGARAVFSTSVAPGVAVVNPGPTIGIGLGGMGGSYSSSVGGGVGLSMPVGGGNVQTGYIASGTLTDVASGKLMWTARASAPPSSDHGRQLQELTRAVVDSAQRAGLL
jgi:hypothetical protein